MVLPFQRTAFMSTIADRMPRSAMPAKFSLPLRRPPEIGAGSVTKVECFDGRARVYPAYDMRQEFTVAEIMPGTRTPVFAYNGSIPGPTVRVHHYEPVLFVKRRGMERRFEGRSALHGVVPAERISGVGSLCHALAGPRLLAAGQDLVERLADGLSDNWSQVCRHARAGPCCARCWWA